MELISQVIGGELYHFYKGEILIQKVNLLFAPMKSSTALQEMKKQDNPEAALSNFVGVNGRISNDYIADLIEVQRLKDIVN